MKILDFLCPKAINLDLESKDKKGVVTELVNLLVKEKKVKDANKAIMSILEREKLGSTGMGQGVAIPHGKTDSVKELVGALGISKVGIPFDSLDGEPVHIIFLLLAPVDVVGEHLRAISCVSRLLRDRFFRQSLLDSKNTSEVIQLIVQEDKV